MRTDKIIIVEGKYDAAAVKRVCEATVIETNGFGLFKNKELKNFIRKYAQKRGVVILTDSDGAGFLIRKHIEGIVDKKHITNAYIPRIEGKEKRKATASKEGLLGVEGMKDSTLLDVLKRAGVEDSATPLSPERPITKLDLFEDGFSGGANAVNKKRLLLKELELPLTLSTNRLLEAMNVFITYDEYKLIVEKLSDIEGEKIV